MIRLPLSRITDVATRQAFEALQDSINTGLEKGSWLFMEFTVPSGVTNHPIPHNLGFIPLDVIATKTDGTLTWHYASFTKDKLFVSSPTGATIRCFIGRV